MKKLIIYTLMLLFLYACSVNESSESTDETTDGYNSTAKSGTDADYQSQKTEYGLVTADASREKEPETQSGNTTKPGMSGPMLIKTGYLTVETKDYSKYRKYVETLVKKSGGYLGNESETNESYRISNEIVLRVPYRNFDSVMLKLTGGGASVDSRRIEVQDIGEEFSDLQARVNAKQAVEKRYLEILNKAQKISEILEVEEKLRIIREETEAAQGRMRYLENQVSYSTIHLSFYTVLDSKYVPPSGPGFFSRIWKGFVKGWEALLNFLIALVYLWPFWIGTGVLIFVLRKRKIFSRFRNRKSS